MRILRFAGTVDDGADRLGEGIWLRQPPGAIFSLRSETGALFYLRTGHLTGP